LRFFVSYLIKYRIGVGLGILALLLTDFAGLAVPWILKEFVDFLPRSPSQIDLLGFAGLLFAAASIQATGRFGWRKYLFGSSRRVEFDILNRVFGHFLILDRPFFQRLRIGDLMSRATNDLRAVRDFMGLGLLILVDSAVVISACFILMTVINPSLAFWVLLPLPLVSILFFSYVETISRRHREVQEHLSVITERVRENIAGIRVLHSFVQEEHEKEKFRELCREYIIRNLRVTRLFGVFTPALVFTIGISGLISLWIGGRAVIEGSMTLGDFVAFNGYLMQLSWPMMGVGYIINLSQRGLVAVSRIDEILSAEPVIRDRAGAVDPGTLEGGIEFRDVSFTYPAAASPSLIGIDLRVNPGQKLAVTGLIGSGKSTLALLIPRLYEVEEGAILVDGRPVTDYPLERLRRDIGYVEQNPFLFSATLRENIALERPDATREEIDEVIENAGLVPDLARFPEGLDTVVGERGVSLSGGQKQRVALARALIKKPRILILDDAFSSLDAETEEIILKRIHTQVRGITTLIITHRLPVVRDADQIIVLDRGTIMERGTHDELMRVGGLYARTCRNQALAREMEITLQ